MLLASPYPPFPFPYSFAFSFSLSLSFLPYSRCIHHNSAVAAVACGSTADSVAEIALRVFCYLCALAIAIAMQQVLLTVAAASCLL